MLYSERIKAETKTKHCDTGTTERRSFAARALAPPLCYHFRAAALKSSKRGRALPLQRSRATAIAVSRVEPWSVLRFTPGIAGVKRFSLPRNKRREQLQCPKKICTRLKMKRTERRTGTPARTFWHRRSSVCIPR